MMEVWTDYPVFFEFPGDVPRPMERIDREEIKKSI
jgi:hypothetical protein